MYKSSNETYFKIKGLRDNYKQKLFFANLI